MMALVCTFPHPHPAIHASILTWVVGWGCGKVQTRMIGH